MFAACVAACGTFLPGESAPGVSASWALEPEPPAVGPPTLTRITLRDAQHAPVAGARLRLEGHMSHPGMTPVIAAVTERRAGEYEAQMPFSMAGDWVLVLTGELADGSRLTRQLDVVGVRPE
jgi:hypothetical protein